MIAKSKHYRLSHLNPITEFLTQITDYQITCHLIVLRHISTYILISRQEKAIREYSGTQFGGTQAEIQDQKAGIQVAKDMVGKAKLAFCIDGQPIGNWFKEQFNKLRQNIHLPMQP